MSGPKETQEVAAPALLVTVIACGQVPGGTTLVYAIKVTQPVQIWTIIRSHDEFVAFGKILQPAFPDLPMLPNMAMMDGGSGGVIDIRASALAIQSWLSKILTRPGLLPDTEVINFLTMGANSIASKYNNLPWVQFDAAAGVASSCSSSSSSGGNAAAPIKANYVAAPHHTKVDDMEMEMEDMFHSDDPYSREYSDDEEDYDDDDDDDEDVPSPSSRYQPTNEDVTSEDQMDLTGEVEMIDDVGSLAQSLGASHLGRSLQRQAEMGQFGNEIRSSKDVNSLPPGGLQIGGAPHEPNMADGGIGSIMQNAMKPAQMVPKMVAPAPLPRLDTFKMIRVIGKGSFGKVFLVRENQSNEIYALKVLRKENIVKRNQVEHTNTERSILGYIRHPFIVGMNMAFQSKEKLFFVLDYCPGGELFFHLGKEGRFHEARARFYAAEIILAISYIHSLDIIYRDLKPENVLLDANGHIRLTDFGLSKEGISNSSSGANSFCGTPEYLAPEILNRQGHGRAVDWWSLGAVLFEMLTGLPPFYSQDREKLFEKIREAELQYPPVVQRHAKALLKGLLAKDPSKRLGSGPGDAADIQQKEFFASIDFDKLMKGEVKAPWRPDLSGVFDTSQFDNEFTRMPIFSPQSLQRQNFLGQSLDQRLFEGFTFTDSRAAPELVRPNNPRLIDGDD